MDSKHTECLDLNDIERFILEQNSEQNETKKISVHLDSCSRCRKIFSELKIFYTILFDELHKPVTNHVINFIKHLNGDDVTISGLILKPQLLDEMPGERHFTSELVLLNPASNEKEEPIILNRDEIYIRIIKSNSTNETTLYLSAENRRLYSDIIFKLPDYHRTFKSDEKGKIEIGKFDIRNLDQQAVMIVTQK